MNPETNINDGKLYIVLGIDNTNCSDPFDLSDDKFPDKVVEKLKDLFIYKLLLYDLDLKDKGVKAEIDVQLINWINWETKEYTLSPVKEISGEKTINCGETIKIKITNESNADVFITILEFRSDRTIIQRRPNYSLGYPSVKLSKGNSHDIAFRSENPGIDIYKILVTKDFINFNPIISSRGNNQKGERGVLNPLEELLFNCYTGSKGNSGSFSGGMTKTLFIKVRK